jgi:hypothetical protein|eukprot:gene12198-8725_t
MAGFDNGEIHGLAGEIRTALESDQYDLGGYSEVRAYDLIRNAFGTPLPAPTKMIKCQFVVGGGKLVRSRYDDDLPKWLIGALREIGFTEDRSAAETFDSQGTYKQQHDTGQNLKYLIVYPRIAYASKPSGGSDATASAPSGIPDEHSPEYIALATDKSTFQDMVGAKVTSYAQKRKLLKFLQEKNEDLKAIEAKLVAGNMLSPSEQAWYDGGFSADEEKLTWLQNEIKRMVDEGKLTGREKADLVKQIEQNIATTQEELTTARADNKPKKVEKLEAKLTTLQQRKSTVLTINPIVPDLANSTEIQKLHIQWFPLQSLEDKQRSMTLTLADLKQVQLKTDLEAQIKELELSSRGWFQDEEDFQERCEAVQAAAKAKFKAKSADAKKKPSTGGGSSLGGGSTQKSGVRPTGLSGWSTVGTKKAGSGVSYASAAKKSGSSSFSALGDSDDD